MAVSDGMLWADNNTLLILAHTPNGYTIKGLYGFMLVLNVYIVSYAYVVLFFIYVYICIHKMSFMLYCKVP